MLGQDDAVGEVARAQTPQIPLHPLQVVKVGHERRHRVHEQFGVKLEMRADEQGPRLIQKREQPEDVRAVLLVGEQLSKYQHTGRHPVVAVRR